MKYSEGDVETPESPASYSVLAALLDTSSKKEIFKRGGAGKGWESRAPG